MSFEEFLVEVQRHYVEQLLAFVRRQRASGRRGAAEVKLQLSEKANVFQRMYCVDYIENDENGQGVVEMAPDRILRFDPMTVIHDGLEIRVESLCWDDVQISFEGKKPDLDQWFDVWFDPHEKNFDPDAELSGRIHSLVVEDDLISIDCGSAPAQALISLFHELAAQGLHSVTVRTGREAS